MKAFWKTVVVVVLAQLSPLALAADAAELDVQAVEMERSFEIDGAAAERAVAEYFETLAGSAENSARLVFALRNGYEATLMGREGDDQATTRIYPVTSRLGLGNVFVSLALAQEALQQVGIDQPQPTEIDAALNGGEVVVGGETARLRGVLSQRVDGVGWGRIAKSMGVRLGPVVASIHSANDRLQREHLQMARGELGSDRSPARVEKAERPARPDRPDRPERPQRPDRPDRPDRPGKAK